MPPPIHLAAVGLRSSLTMTRTLGPALNMKGWATLGSAMAVLCWTLPNSQPLIYTGQEVGYNHRFEFFEGSDAGLAPQRHHGFLHLSQ